MYIKPLSGEQQRQLIDTTELFEAWRAAEKERLRRFSGSMRWVERRGGRIYLLRKIAKTERSLGPRNEQTEQAFENFQTGRKRNRERLVHLSRRIDEMAPVNKAMGIGRVPPLTARILRECDHRDLLGRQILVVGTNALFAYEAKVGVHLSAGLITTGDIDFLLDVRRRLTFAGREVSKSGLLGLLKKIDSSFAASGANGIRAMNRDGYFVDLIRPEPRDIITDKTPDRLGRAANDLAGAPITGLKWLMNAPRLTAVSIDEKGYPLRLVGVDPRVFALHKLWLSGRKDRDPRKKTRDLEQALAAAEIAARHLGLSFEDRALEALPQKLRDQAPRLVSYPGAEARGTEGLEEEPGKLSPNW